ncbi:hypothetical protein J6590_038783 [Homalodisca vitripennis]|nr:hypothetical protein J6590_038783 [Homalodisca vitripennis]
MISLHTRIPSLERGRKNMGTKVGHPGTSMSATVGTPACERRVARNITPPLQRATATEERNPTYRTTENFYLLHGRESNLPHHRELLTSIYFIVENPTYRTTEHFYPLHGRESNRTTEKFNLPRHQVPRACFVVGNRSYLATKSLFHGEESNLKDPQELVLHEHVSRPAIATYASLSGRRGRGWWLQMVPGRFLYEKLPKENRDKTSDLDGSWCRGGVNSHMSAATCCC